MRINAAAAALLRRRQDELAIDADALRGRSVTCAPAMVVQTFAEGTYPTAAGRYFACHPVVVSGIEDENENVLTAPDTNTIMYVANLGSAIPPAGTKRVATLVGGRWGMAYDG